MILVLAGLRKLRTRTASVVALIVAAILVALEFLLVGVSISLPSETGGAGSELYRSLLTFPAAYDGILAIVFVFGGLVAMIYVVAAAGTEWTWGTLKVAVTRGESRARYALATFGSLAIVLLVGVVVTFIAGVLGAVCGAAIAGMPINGLTDAAAMPHVVVSIVRCWIAVVCLCAVGYAIAMIAKNQMAGVGMSIGVFVASLVVPIALPKFLQDIFEYLPFSISSDAIGLSPVGVEGSRVAPAVDPNAALLITLGWIAASLAVAALATERAEISG